MAYDAAMKRYSWAKIGFSLIELFLLLVVFPWILKISQADYIPCWQFIFAVWVGFLFANLRSISKLVNIWDYKRVKTIGRLVPVYFPNYLITLVAICLIASYLFSLDGDSRKVYLGIFSFV